jgi:hypothetical protein
MSNPKLQVPNPNHFHPQGPTPGIWGLRLGIVGVWDLGVDWDLELGAWDYPVFRMPAATPLMVASRALRN